MKATSERIQEVLDRTCTGTVIARSDGSQHHIFPIAIHPREGERLREWVTKEGASKTIEIGFAYGLSTLFILQGLVASAAEEGRHLAIDPNQIHGFASIGLQLVDEAGLADRLDFIVQPSEVALPRLLEQGRQFDFAFVDGNHRFDAVFVDLVYLGRLLRAGGAIFVDDYQLPSISKAVAFYVNNLGWTIEERGAADNKHHWIVLRLPSQPRERAFDYFIDF